MNATRSDWCDLSWGPWLPFSEKASFKQLPTGPGLYRVRAINEDRLFYIGETGRNLRERLGDLRRNALQDEMPFNDPHTAAPSLWAWHDAEGLAFACSAITLPLAENLTESRKIREGLKCYLLWQYRLEYGSSTVCNHGHFHPHYLKSTDRKKGKRGGRRSERHLPALVDRQSLPPLRLIHTPIDEGWMGLAWSFPYPLTRAAVKSIPRLPGVYKLLDRHIDAVLYIGESQNLQERLRTHLKKSWNGLMPHVSYVPLPPDTQAYQRHEIENDLLGGFYALSRTIPPFQLIDHH